MVAPVDLLLTVCIAVPALWGLWHGLISGASGPLAIAFAGFAALGVGPEIGKIFFGGDAEASLMGAGIVFVVGWIWVRLLGALLRRIARIAMLGWADHLTGALAGGLAGALAGGWLLLTAAHFLPEQSPRWEGSELLPTCSALLEVFTSDDVAKSAAALTGIPPEG